MVYTNLFDIHKRKNSWSWYRVEMEVYNYILYLKCQVHWQPQLCCLLTRELQSPPNKQLMQSQYFSRCSFSWVLSWKILVWMFKISYSCPNTCCNWFRTVWILGVQYPVVASMHLCPNRFSFPYIYILYPCDTSWIFNMHNFSTCLRYLKLKDAEAKAAELDAVPEKERGPLHGIPVSIKVHLPNVSS